LTGIPHAGLDNKREVIQASAPALGGDGSGQVIKSFALNAYLSSRPLWNNPSYIPFFVFFR
jgi:hypothetical protein